MANGEEDRKNREHRDKARLINKLFIVTGISVGAYMLVEMFVFKNAKSNFFNYLFINPFSKDSRAFAINYFEKQYYVPLSLFIISILNYLFWFGKPSSKLIQKLEYIKRKVFEFLPLLMTGQDERNQYIRFGLEKAFMKAFLEREVVQKSYLERVSFLNIFVEEYSPTSIFHNDVKGLFKDDGFIDLFQIIEGYLKKVVEVVSDIELKDFEAMHNQSIYNDASFVFFLKNDYAKKDPKRASKILHNIYLKNNDKTSSMIKKILRVNKIEQEYKAAMEQKVYFSPKAVYQMVSIATSEMVRFLERSKKLKTSAFLEAESILGEVDITEIATIYELITFYKIISLYMGFPSAIVTARMDLYKYRRVIDDIEHYEKIGVVKIIDEDVNGKNTIHDDTFARAYMILHHELNKRSKYKTDIINLMTKFDAVEGKDKKNEFTEHIDSTMFNEMESYLRKSQVQKENSVKGVVNG